MKQLPSNVTGKDAMAETLTAFQIFLQNRDMSPNTISSYMFGAKDFLERYGEITPEHISLYKAYLIDHYRPQTVNARIRALNSFLRFQQKENMNTQLLKINFFFLQVHSRKKKLSQVRDKSFITFFHI